MGIPSHGWRLESVSSAGISEVLGSLMGKAPSAKSAFSFVANAWDLVARWEPNIRLGQTPPMECSHTARDLSSPSVYITVWQSVVSLSSFGQGIPTNIFNFSVSIDV
jgi:hypothetical protein